MVFIAAVGLLPAREEIVWNRPLARAMVAGLGVLLVGGGALLVRLRVAPAEGRRPVAMRGGLTRFSTLARSSTGQAEVYVRGRDFRPHRHEHPFAPLHRG
jgi:hypothetical protein